MSSTAVAIDLGASSGRVLRGILTDGRLSVEECSRFANSPVTLPHGASRDAGADEEDLVWDVLSLWSGIRAGLVEAARRGPVDAIGIDTWGVDYGLLSADGRLIANPWAYRCKRTDQAVERVHTEMPQETLYRYNGTQHQPFNTLFQLVADRSLAPTEAARTALLIPDLIAYWLTGRQVCEVTNASTTGLIDPASRRWSPEILGLLHDQFRVRVPDLLADLVEPGTLVGSAALSDLSLRTSAGAPTPVVAVGSHDTASAVVGVPAPGRSGRFGFISSGTWSLVGVELDHPVRSPASATANFTNELGVDGTVRYLSNVMGMWMLQEILRQWREAGEADLSWPQACKLAGQAEPWRTMVDVNDELFALPGPMTERIDLWALDHHEQPPQTHGQYLRAVIDSLAAAYRRALGQAQQLSGTHIETVNIVGGGSQNALLCQLTADATGLPVIAGPVEGTAMGNIVVSLRAIGALDGGLDELRQVIANSVITTRYEARPGRGTAWQAAEERVLCTGQSLVESH
ncbi:MAG: rhamnulokinase [Acidipropionibacterium sp.]|jgi:rhamnulokinase|nr:rhamnulokinase [Acidipropionibacterium sp.]